MPQGGWNKGKSYTFSKRIVYARKNSWNLAMRRMFGSSCMICNWDEAPCDTHHILPKREGGQMTLENGIILCPNCHRMADFNVITREELLEIKLNAKIIGIRI